MHRRFCNDVLPKSTLEDPGDLGAVGDMTRNGVGSLHKTVLQGIQLPNDGLQEGGLPRADSADDTHELSLWDGHIQLLQCGFLSSESEAPCDPQRRRVGRLERRWAHHILRSIGLGQKSLDSVEAIGYRHQPRDAVGHLRDIAQQGADEALQDHDAMRRDTALSLGEPNCNQEHAPGHSVLEGSHEASDRQHVLGLGNFALPRLAKFIIGEPFPGKGFDGSD
mmetsp:Transcript_56604/g.123801  ORF Transcript_56604/g.123801 Transcript_56604/m.123801 type:complete len:222 (-) Transcript_56604:244-909(-)